MNTQLMRGKEYFDPGYIAIKYPDLVILESKIKKVAHSLALHPQVPIQIIGETGTGKEFLTKYIHRCRELNSGKTPFVAVNCALLNNDLAESFLFGHRKGAFTGAHDHSRGAVEEANGGILFLDELQCLSLSAQQKLLRLLNDKTYSRVGESVERRSEFHLITACNQNLDDLVESGRFLLDVQMRIAGYAIRLAPLREQTELLEDLLASYLYRNGSSITVEAHSKLMNAFLKYSWPGNVRQLFRLLDSMTLRSKIDGIPLGVEIIQDCLPANLCENASTKEPAVKSLNCPIEKAVSDLMSVKGKSVDLQRLLLTIESSVIEYALGQFSSLQDAMVFLNLTRNQLDFKRRKFQLNPPGQAPSLQN